MRVLGANSGVNRGANMLTSCKQLKYIKNYKKMAHRGWAALGS